MTHQVQFEQWVPVALEQVFLFFANPGNLPRIMPPGTGTELVRLKLIPPPGIPPVRESVTDRDPLAGIGSEIITSFRVARFLPFRVRGSQQLQNSNGTTTSPTCKRKGRSKVSTIAMIFRQKRETE
jgi:hypothetical protein